MAKNGRPSVRGTLTSEGSDGHGRDFIVYGTTAGKYAGWTADNDTFGVTGSLLVTGETFIQGGLNNRTMVEVFDDFFYQTITEADTPWIFNKGIDAQAVDPAIVAAQPGGVIRLTTGNADGAVANDASQIVLSLPILASYGGLVFETRLKINTAITTVSVCAGFTDASGLEEPFSVAGTTVTAVADDAACFVYDTAMTTDQWWACAVDGTTVDTGAGTTAVAPVQDTFQVLRIEVSEDGNTIKYYIDGTLKKTLTGGGISPDATIYATVIANATTTTSKTVDIDYIYVAHERP